MAIIPIIFFALIFGVGSLFGSTESSFSTEASPAEPSPAAASANAVMPPMPSRIVKSMFDNREELPPCDTWQCLESSATGAGGELVRPGFSQGGDPVTSYYRVTLGTLEVFTDNHGNQTSADPAWTYEICAIPDNLRAGCTGS